MPSPMFLKIGTKLINLSLVEMVELQTNPLAPELSQVRFDLGHPESLPVYFAAGKESDAVRRFFGVGKSVEILSLNVLSDPISFADEGE